MQLPKQVVDLLKVASPTLLSAFLGPLGGIAATIAAPLLDRWLAPITAPAVPGTAPPAVPTPALMVQAMEQNLGDPDLLERLKKVEKALADYEDSQDFKFAELELKERQSNRDFQANTGIADEAFKFAKRIVYVAFGSLSVLALAIVLMMSGIIKFPYESQTIVTVGFSIISSIVSIFSTWAVMVLNFYYSRSRGDDAKTDILHDALRQQSAQLGEAAATASRAAEVAAAKPPSPTPVVVVPAPVQTAPAPAAPEVPTESRFTSYIGDLLQSEGGYVDNPKDPGGCTNFGITIGTLREWRGTAVTCDDVKAMTWDEARSIYFSKYWNAMQCDALPEGLDYMVFDFGVNAGTRTSGRLLQECLQKRDQKLKADGVIGPLTLAVLANVPAKALLDEFHAAKMAYYRSLAGWATFGDGWTNRANRVLAQAKTLAEKAA